MSTLLSKSIAILAGIVFFAGGSSLALAATDLGAQQPVTASSGTQPATGPYNPSNTYWAFKWRISQGLIAGTINFVTGTGAQPGNYSSSPTQAGCTAESAQVAQSEVILSPCAQYTGAQLNALTQQASAANATYNQTLDQSIFNPAQTQQDETLKKFNLNCDITNGWLSKGQGNFADCIPIAFYYVVYKPASWLLVGSLYVFDTTLAMSISKKFIEQPFVESSWIIIRDFSNMVFIFILLYTGIMTMFGQINWKRTVINVVIVALLINFSLFFTRVIIDAGNILAVGIYQSMGTPKAAGERHLADPSVEERNIATAIAGSFGPGRFINAAGSVDRLDAIVIFIIAAVVSVVTAWVFFKAALLFVGRLIGFWVLMIISPLAFISATFPKGDRFKEWMSTLIDQAFVAPVFLFFIYIIMQIVNTGGGLLGNFTTGNSDGTVMGFFFSKLIGPIIVAAIIVKALQYALDVAKKMAGKSGEGGASLATGAIGIGLGGTALLGRKVVGGAASAALKSGKLQDLAQSKNKFVSGFAKSGVLAANMAQKGSWDARNIGGKGLVGSYVSKGVGSLGLGKGTGEGGYKKAAGEAAKKADEKDRERANLFDIPQEEKDRVKREAEAKIKEAEEKAAKAQKASEESATGQQVKIADEAVKATQKVAEEAVKKIDEAQKAYDTGTTGSGNAQDLKLAQDLHDAKEAAKTSARELATNEAALVAATAKHASSQAAVDLALATKAVAAAKRTGQQEIDNTTAESARRREVSAKQAEARGMHKTAEKIRNATPVEKESELDKIKKELKAEIEKEAKEKGGDTTH